VSNNPLIDTLIALSGQDEVLVIHRSFVRFTGSIEAALMLNQLLYWTPKSKLEIDDKTGWIARSDREWADELLLTQYAVRQARATLAKFALIETKLRKFGGTPKLHYRLILDNVITYWSDFVKTQSPLCEITKRPRADSAKTQSPLGENDESFIETPIKTPSLESKGKQAASAARPPSSEQPALFADDPDQTTDFNGELDAIFKAALVKEARAAGRRGPSKWGSLAQKQQFRKSAEHIVDHKGIDELQRAIDAGLQRERKSRDALVAWIKAWADNVDKPRPQDKQRSQSRRNNGGRYTGGPSLSREQMSQWYGGKQ